MLFLTELNIKGAEEVMVYIMNAEDKDAGEHIYCLADQLKFLIVNI